MREFVWSMVRFLVGPELYLQARPSTWHRGHKKVRSGQGEGYFFRQAQWGRAGIFYSAAYRVYIKTVLKLHNVLKLLAIHFSGQGEIPHVCAKASPLSVCCLCNIAFGYLVTIMIKHSKK
jgi:hypothetical protein